MYGVFCESEKGNKVGSEKKIDTSNWSDDDWLALLLLFAASESGKEWDSFAKEIKEKSRFFPESKLLDSISEISNDAAIILEKGDVYYRARVMNNFFMYENKKELKELEELIVSYYPELRGKSFEEMSYVFRDPIGLFSAQIFDGVKRILKKKKRFWGYATEGSDAPPKGSASSGRANSEGISVLYLADSPSTAVLEVRPLIGQDVSVAKVKILDELKLFDFTRKDGFLSDFGNALSYMVISKAFSEPFSGKSLDYAPTQYLCEYIKRLGFDGIKYNSAMKNDAYNIAIFNIDDPKKYRIIKSEVLTVKGYDISTVQFAPWKE